MTTTREEKLQEILERWKTKYRIVPEHGTPFQMYPTDEANLELISLAYDAALEEAERVGEKMRHSGKRTIGHCSCDFTQAVRALREEVKS